MEISAGLVFLSHWSGDQNIVQALDQKLDRARTFIDIRSMEPGVQNLAQMKAAITTASLFMFIVSPQTPADCFSFFEATHAEFEKARRRTLEIVVWPINGASYKNSPEWMQRYFAIPEAFTTSDVAREIRFRVFQNLVTAGHASYPVYEGRENLEREIAFDYLSNTLIIHKAINVLVLSGLPGMGRTSLARHLPRRLFPAMREVNPEFDLPEEADAVDLYLYLFADLEPLTLDRVKALRGSFPADPGQEAQLIAKCLDHWGQISQTVIVRMRRGLRERGPGLRPWFAALLKQLEDYPKVRLILVSSRKLDPGRIEPHPNIRNYDISELESDTILYVLTKLVEPRWFNPVLFQRLATLSAGHPDTAHHVAYLINKGRSPDTVLANPHPIYAFQDRVLESIYKEAVLADLEKNILSILCWFPRLDFKLLQDIFSEISSPPVLAKTLWDLSDNCLIEQTQSGTYHLPTVVRSTFARRLASIPPHLEAKTVVLLKELLKSADLMPEQLEPLLVAYTTADAEIPDFIRQVITPGALASVVELHYDKGRSTDDRDELVRSFSVTAKLAEFALAFKIPNETLENILTLGADAMARLGSDPEPLARELEKRGFSAAFYVTRIQPPSA